MNRSRSSFRVIVAALSIGFSLSLATANAVERPMKGSFVGSGFTFGGNFTHLGSFTGEITFFNGVETTLATWTAANGDTVDVISIFTITGFDSETGLYIFHQAIKVLGGTGRFAGATGTIAGDGETTPTFSYYFGVIKGTIDY